MIFEREMRNGVGGKWNEIFEYVWNVPTHPPSLSRSHIISLTHLKISPNSLVVNIKLLLSRAKLIQHFFLYAVAFAFGDVGGFIHWIHTRVSDERRGRVGAGQDLLYHMMWIFQYSIECRCEHRVNAECIGFSTAAAAAVGDLREKFTWDEWQRICYASEDRQAMMMRVGLRLLVSLSLSLCC